MAVQSDESRQVDNPPPALFMVPLMLRLTGFGRLSRQSETLKEWRSPENSVICRLRFEITI
jgi:hypothetical protein